MLKLSSNTLTVLFSGDGVGRATAASRIVQVPAVPGVPPTTAVTVTVNTRSAVFAVSGNTGIAGKGTVGLPGGTVIVLITGA